MLCIAVGKYKGLAACARILSTAQNRLAPLQFCRARIQEMGTHIQGRFNETKKVWNWVPRSGEVRKCVKKREQSCRQGTLLVAVAQRCCLCPTVVCWTFTEDSIAFNLVILCKKAFLLAIPWMNYFHYELQTHEGLQTPISISKKKVNITRLLHLMITSIVFFF